MNIEITALGQKQKSRAVAGIFAVGGRTELDQERRKVVVLTLETGPIRVRNFGYISYERGVYRCRRNDFQTSKLPLH